MQRSTLVTVAEHFELSNGEVIGINTAKVATDSVEGMGYAIPISDANDTIQNFDESGDKDKSVWRQNKDILESRVMSRMKVPRCIICLLEFIFDVVNGGPAGMESDKRQGYYRTWNHNQRYEFTERTASVLSCGDKVKVTVQVPGNNGEYTEKLSK